MEIYEHAEKILADSVTSISVSRDEVRGWVIQEQARSQRRASRLVLATVVCFLVLSSGLWFSADHQMQKIRQLIDRQPSKAIAELTEISEELCDAPLADYFVRQLSHRKRINRRSMTSVAVR